MGMVECMRRHNVSCTATINKRSRFHVVYQLPVPFSKSRKLREHRGKYRSAQTEVEGVQVNCCLWSDSALIGYASCDLGTKQVEAVRQQGRHRVTIACPELVVERGKYFRAVDSHDQLRLGRLHFAYITKSKPWPEVFFGLIELTLVNIYIVCKQFEEHKDLTQNDFRWRMLEEILEIADEIDDRNFAAERAQERPAEVAEVSRHHPKSKDLHHWCQMSEYVDVETAKEMLVLMQERPAVSGKAALARRRKPRSRDRFRKDGKVLNPAYFISSCVVCWAETRGTGKKPTKTNKYCRECKKEDNWPKGMTRGGGYMNDFHPRLCSRRCWDRFHTERIQHLDVNQWKQHRPGC